MNVKAKFENAFGCPPEHLFSAPGRTELGGNHTDHQHGVVLAAAVNLKTRAAVRENGTDTINLISEGYPAVSISLADLAVHPEETGSTAALIRGVAASFASRGCTLRGFDAFVTSEVPAGSGLSSSAAFEVLIASVLNELFFSAALSPVELAQIGQYAENVYFGKPCGLMDQTACAVGGVIGIDFCDPAAPVVEKAALDLTQCGYALCIIDSGADHAALTDEYAAITEELAAVCAVFGKTVLRDVDENEFYARISEVRHAAGDRAVLRAMHVFRENRRAKAEFDALKAGDFDAFLRLVTESGRSSWLYLQNVLPTGATSHQEMAFSLALADQLLAGKGAVRVHGGGFAGTIQAFVPLDGLDSFRSGMEKALGPGACHVLSVSPKGTALDV